MLIVKHSENFFLREREEIFFTYFGPYLSDFFAYLDSQRAMVMRRL